jgi:hypothetical protein
MIEWVLDQRYAQLHGGARTRPSVSVIVFGAMEATLTPLMEDIEARFDGIKVFSLPSVDHPEHGRHIELGVKGRGEIPCGRPLRRCGKGCCSLVPGWAPSWCAESPRSEPEWCVCVHQPGAVPAKAPGSALPAGAGMLSAKLMRPL